MNRRSFLLGLPSLIVPSLAQAAAITRNDADILTRTVYGEAVGESEKGQIAVAHVIFNRVRSTDPQFKRDTTVSATCLRPGQFSCWRDAHRLRHLDLSRAPAADVLNLIWLATHQYLRGEDYSNGATFFVRAGTIAPGNTEVVTRIGKHIFMKSRSK